jgi:hypothetical protein
VRLINLAIQDAVAEQLWNTDDSDPCFNLAYNTATMKAYVEIDTTKMSSGTQFAIKMNTSTTTLYDMLGFPSTPIATDGITEATSYAKVDMQGNHIKVNVGGLGTLSFDNGSNSTEICQIPMQLAQSNDNYYRLSNTNISYPQVDIFCSNEVSSLDFTFTNDYNNNQLLALDGRTQTAFVIIEIGEY